MTKFFMRGMTRATELTRSGKLSDATALIQSLLQPKATSDTGPDGGAAHQNLADKDVIEGTFSEVGGAAPVPPAPRVGRKGLGETLRDLASRRMQHAGTKPAAPVDLPTGAEFLSLTHANPQGSRAYRLYVPARKPAGPMPLIVMLHGCTQSPEDFALGTGMNALAEEFGHLVAWPAQPQQANAQKCWNWFRPEDQGRDQGEPAVIAGIISDIVRDYPVDAGRVYVAGLSAGGAAAAIMGAAYPELIAAIGVHSGLPVGSAKDVVSAFAAMRSGSSGKDHRTGAPVIAFHGLADMTVHPSNGAAVIEQTVRGRQNLNTVSESGLSEGGRRYRRTRHEDKNGRSIAEHWEIDGASHAWSGGTARGSYTDPAGPDASREMLRFFAQHKQA